MEANPIESGGKLIQTRRVLSLWNQIEPGTLPDNTVKLGKSQLITSGVGWALRWKWEKKIHLPSFSRVPRGSTNSGRWQSISAALDLWIDRFESITRPPWIARRKSRVFFANGRRRSAVGKGRLFVLRKAKLKVTPFPGRKKKNNNNNNNNPHQ